MSIAEKIQVSADKNRFTLFKEGLFYKCYNEDAMVFTQKVRAYKVSTKFIKSVGAEVLSLGFPVSEVEKGNIKLLSISESIGAESYKVEPYSIVFSLKDDIKHNYNEFQTAIITAKEPDTGKLYNNYTANNQKLAKMIQEFDLANSTPMQGLAFIQELKKHIKTPG